MASPQLAFSSTDDARKTKIAKQQVHQADTERDVPPEKIENPYLVNGTQSQHSKRKLPPMLDHFNAKDLKRLFKCSLPVWIQALLIFVNPTLKVMGSAAFVGCIVLFLAPPAGILFIQLMATISILVGLSIGWAWGIIAMKAALATRPAADLAARYALLQQMSRNATNTGQATGDFLQIQIFERFMLDTRVTVTYFCLVGLFVYLVARLRVAVPKLILVQMLVVIVSNVFLTDAPLIPTFQGTLAKTLILPCAITTGIGVVCNILIFPTSSSSEALDGMKMLLSPMPAFLDACLLSFKHPNLRMSSQMLIETRLQILKAYKGLEPATNFLPMDISIGRWSSDDFSTLNKLLRRVVISFLGLMEVHRSREEHKEKDAEAVKLAEATYDAPDGQSAARPGHHQMG